MTNRSTRTSAVDTNQPGKAVMNKSLGITDGFQRAKNVMTLATPLEQRYGTREEQNRPLHKFLVTFLLCDTEGPSGIDPQNPLKSLVGF